MTEYQKSLELRWKQFQAEYGKNCIGKGTVAKSGNWEPRRDVLFKEMIRAGIRTKDGYTVLFDV